MKNIHRYDVQAIKLKKKQLYLDLDLSAKSYLESIPFFGKDQLRNSRKSVIFTNTLRKIQDLSIEMYEGPLFLDLDISLNGSVIAF